MPSNLMPEINEMRADTIEFSDSATDEALVAGAKEGDERAFEMLVKRHRRQVFALALRYTRVHEDAEDVVQQTFQKTFVYLRVLVFNVVNAYCHKRGTDVATKSSRIARGAFKRSS